MTRWNVAAARRRCLAACFVLLIGAGRASVALAQAGPAGMGPLLAGVYRVWYDSKNQLDRLASQ